MKKSKAFLAIFLSVVLSLSFANFSPSTVNASQDYVPNRSVTIIPNDEDPSVNPTFFIMTEHSTFAAGGPFTVTGKVKFVKGDDISGDALHCAKIDATGETPDLQLDASTDGWIDITDGEGNPLTFEFNSGWLHFGMWYTKGEYSVADVVIKNAAGEVVYDMVTDTELWADGTVDNPMAAKGIWYCYSYGSGTSKFTFKTNYSPEKWFVLDCETDINPQFHFTLKKDSYASGGPFTVSYKVKLDNLAPIGDTTDQSFRMTGTAGDNVVNTPNVWVDVTGSFDNLTEDGKISMYLWYASCKLTFADFTIKNAANEIVYSMAQDTALNVNNLTHSSVAGDWLIWDYAGAAIDVLVMPQQKDPPPAEVDEPTVVEDIIIPHDNNYNRIIGIHCTDNVNPTFRMSILYDDPMFAEANGPFTIQSKIKIANFNKQQDDGKAFVDFNFSDDGTVNKASFTSDTDGYVTLKDNDGKDIYFDTLTDQDLEIIFGLYYASGDLTVADFKIVDADGKVVYSMANDPTLYGVTDMKNYGGSPGMWFASDYAGDNSSVIFVTTKQDEYVPNRVISVTPTATMKNAAINPVLIINTNSSLFESDKTYTIKGKVKVNLTGQIDHPVEKMNSFIAGRFYGNTNGWVSITMKDGSFFTFTGQTGYVNTGMWYALGNFSLADLTIYDDSGNLVYDMAADGDFWEDQTSKSLEWDSDSVIIPSAYGAAAECYFTVFTADEYTPHSEDDYGIPLFDEQDGNNDTDPTDDENDPTDPIDETDPTDETDPSNVQTGVSAGGTIPAAALVIASIGLICLYRKKK